MSGGPGPEKGNMRSWKTTVSGVLTIVVAIGSAALGFMQTGALPDLGVLAAAITAGVGLIVARDNDKSSEQVGAK